jgi:RNA polymerase sigma-70 factor, ECF subfamily
VTDTPYPAVAPSPSPGLLLHQRLLAGDVTAPAEIADTYLSELVAYLERRYPAVDDPHLPSEAAIDALYSYLQRPKQYNPEKTGLDTYLRMAAEGDLLNALQKQARERQRQGGEQVVELDAPGAEYKVEAATGPTVEEQVDARLSPVWPKIEALVPNPVDKEIVRLMMEKVRKTAVFASVLGITHLPLDKQLQEVKRHKDRIKKRLKRHLHLEDTDDE